MGYWFGESSDCYPWRKTPTKIGDTWYTPTGEVVRNPSAYFAAIERNGRYWEGNTGWDSDRFHSCNLADDDDFLNDLDDYYEDEDYYIDEKSPFSSSYDECDYDDFCDSDDYEYNQDIYNP